MRLTATVGTTECLLCIKCQLSLLRTARSACTLNDTLISLVTWQNTGQTGLWENQMEPALVSQDGA